ncbi:hypothetical protein CY35_04G021400 [Sphagnum magellanicum]|nr:hypothetical protein CY35_04G021400 [Sphagnum magellanicum]
MSILRSHVLVPHSYQIHDLHHVRKQQSSTSRSSSNLSTAAMGIRANSVPFLETATSTDHVAEPLSAATILYKSFLSIKSSRKVQQKEFDASTAAAIWVCDCLEKVFVRMFADSDHMTTAAAHPAADQKSRSSNFHLDGYYAPVDGETIPTSNLPVSGSIPECLNGEIVRAAPNPRFNPIADYQWFDGDGMLHGLKIKDGKATYVARFVRTSRLEQEENYGAAKFPKIGDMYGHKGILLGFIYFLRVLLGVLDISNGFGTANTAFVYHHNKLLALYEADKPYAIKVKEDGDLETVGREHCGSQFSDFFTAHPKIDPVTGEMFGFCYQLVRPFLTYQVFSKEGDLMESVPITLPQSVVIHDFAITENYAIFMDLSFVMGFKNLFQAEHLFKFDPKKESRLGILPRYARNESQIRWFTIPSCMIFHNANAWEEGDEVVLISCRSQKTNTKIWKEKFPQENHIDLEKPQLYEFRMNLKTNQVTQKQLSLLAIECPEINEEYTGRKQRYVYASMYDDKLDKFIGVVKYDLSLQPKRNPKDLKVEGNIQGVFYLGDRRWGSEPTFVPRTNGKEISEDDGYLICFVHDEKSGNSEVVIIDAKTMASRPVAVISLPSKVPSGFHSIFLSQEQLSNQNGKPKQLTQ